MMRDMRASSAAARRLSSVLVHGIDAALPQSHRHVGTDARPAARPYVALVFARVLVALDSRSGRRDALLLGAQLASTDGAVVVADLLPTAPTPLGGGSAASARRRDRLRDGGEEVYAIMGPDPRVRYMPVAGLPLVDAVGAIARSERTSTIVLPQSVAGDAAGLVADCPCLIAIAPYGHRFARPFAPRRAGVPAQDARAKELLAAAQRLLPDCVSVLVDHGGDADLLVVGDVDTELLHEARCPVLVIGERAATRLIAPPLRR
jgi:hypothetical protein